MAGRSRNTFKLEAAVRTQDGPSLNRTIGYNHMVNQRTTTNTITIITTNFLKNIREELLEENSHETEHHNTEIAYVSTEINGVHVKVMVDTGANVSVIDNIELSRIQEKGNKIIPTLPVNNIVLIGATAVSYTHLDVYKRQMHRL